MNVYDIQYRTVATTKWKRDAVITEQSNDGWNFVREERVTARKVAIVFWKKIPRPIDPDAELKRKLAENLTESDSM